MCIPAASDFSGNYMLTSEFSLMYGVDSLSLSLVFKNPEDYFDIIHERENNIWKRTENNYSLFQE